MQLKKLKRLFILLKMEPTKYKFVETIGCTAFDFSINEKSISEHKEQELDEILDYLFLKAKEGIKDNTILFQNVVQLFQPDDWEHDSNICEQCGDSVSTTIWNI